MEQKVRSGVLDDCAGRSADDRMRDRGRVVKVKQDEPPRVHNGTKRNLGANAEIGRKLKQYYDSILSEEIPDRFSQLLGQLDNSEKNVSQD